MSARKILKRISARLFLILFIVIFLTIGTVYVTSVIYSNKQLSEYQKANYIEQAYTLGMFLGLTIEGDLSTEKNRDLFDSVAKSHSIQYELVDVKTDKRLYKSAIDIDETDPFIVEAPVLSNGKNIAYMRVYYDIDRSQAPPTLKKYKSSITKQWNWIVMITILILIISAFVIAKLYAKSIKPTVTSALAVLQGKREIQVPKSGMIELDYLVESVNAVLTEFNKMEDWRKQMMEDLTHEIRTPITSVLLMMEAIIDGVYPTSTENLQKIYKEVDRLSRLIMNVQNLSEAEGAQFDLNTKKVNIIPLIKGTYDGFLFVAAQKNIKLHLNLPNKPCVAKVDSDRFVQVITNLISNALKYTEERGTVEIGLEASPSEIIFYCLDNGVGISEEEQILVFNRFYRVEKSRTRENGGLGIGLNISHALAQAHGWEMGVESKLGEGSKFTVKIPLHTEVSLKSSTDRN